MQGGRIIMKIRVLYHSRGGNTRKIADVIAEALGIVSEQITDSISLDSTDLLFIGDGIYGGKADSVTDKLISKLSSSNVKNVAVFGTYGGQPISIDKMKTSIKSKGIHVIDESFGSKGKFFLLFNRNHPNEEDLNRAKLYAKRVVDGLK